MTRIIWHLLGRFCEARAQRALTRHVRLSRRAEKFFGALGVIHDAGQ
ncbi:hypothetical protein [Paracoccus sp. (in: a-proteobacteria)]